ncbi:hypothetical protein C8R43DRAFT_350514 [Mycena crocata]|nr:hypothetical protein C8R43DRAFT_350514 [Mycena crocata]
MRVMPSPPLLRNLGSVTRSSQCEPTANDGTSLERSNLQAVNGSLIKCKYSGGSVCFYLPSTGSLTSQAGPGACPSKLASSPPSQTETSLAAPSTTSLSASSATSPSTASETSPSKRGKAILVPAAAGTSASVAILVIVTAIFLILRTRRRRQHRFAAGLEASNFDSSAGIFSSTPIEDVLPGSTATTPVEADAEGVSNTSLTPRYLEPELLAADEKTSREELERRTTRGRESESPGLAQQLEAAKGQIDVMATRIRELEVNADFAWGVGISDLPPPVYVSK